MHPMTNAPNDDQFCQESWLSILNRSVSASVLAQATAVAASDIPPSRPHTPRWRADASQSQPQPRPAGHPWQGEAGTTREPVTREPVIHSWQVEAGDTPPWRVDASQQMPLTRA